MVDLDFCFDFLVFCCAEAEAHDAVDTILTPGRGMQERP